MKQLQVANKPCSLCNKHMVCIIEPKREGRKPCAYYADWHEPRYEKDLKEAN